MNHVACPNRECEMTGWPLLDDTGEQHVCARCGTPLESIESPAPRATDDDDPDDPGVGSVYEGGPTLPDDGADD